MFDSSEFTITARKPGLGNDGSLYLQAINFLTPGKLFHVSFIGKKYTRVRTLPPMRGEKYIYPKLFYGIECRSASSHLSPGLGIAETKAHHLGWLVNPHHRAPIRPGSQAVLVTFYFSRNLIKLIQELKHLIRKLPGPKRQMTQKAF